MTALLLPYLKPTDHICDAGCGLGYLVLACSPHAAHITAAERDAAALSVLRQELDALGITNVTPLCADVLAYTPPVPFDAMVFCFFGSMEEILAAALRQCRGTVLAVVRDDVCHRFSGAPRAPGRHSFDAACGVLGAHGIPYTAQRAALDFPQPFRTLEDARTFLTLYGGGAPAEDDLRAKLISTGDPTSRGSCRRPPLWNNCIYNERRRIHMNKTKRLLALVLALVMSLTRVRLRTKQTDQTDQGQDAQGETTRVFTDSCGREVKVPADIQKVASLRTAGPDGGLCHRPCNMVGVANAWDETAENYFDQQVSGPAPLGQLYGGKGEAEPGERCWLPSRRGHRCGRSPNTPWRRTCTA